MRFPGGAAASAKWPPAHSAATSCNSCATISYIRTQVLVVDGTATLRCHNFGKELPPIHNNPSLTSLPKKHIRFPLGWPLKPFETY